jgi:Tol biopolymer transport system component
LRGLTFDRRALTFALIIGLLVALVGGALLIGARLLSPTSDVRLSHLVYALDGDIYVADWDGANPVRIADGDPGPSCKEFVANGGLVSPDGQYVAYRSGWDDSCDGGVYISDLAGHLVASFPGAGWNIAWSPDSTRVATWLNFGKTIGIYGLDGEVHEELDGSRMCCGDHDPAWSPDGAASIIIKESGTSGPVWELPDDGGPPRRVPPDDPRIVMAYSLNPPAYSADGTRAAFIVPWELANGTGPQLREDPYVLRDFLVVSAPDGSQRQVLVEAEPTNGLTWDQTLVWSATGDRIAYVLSRELSQDAAGNPVLFTSDLWVVDSRTGAAKQVASARGSGPLRPFEFSPGGDRILFGQSDEDNNQSLWSVNTDGSGAQTLVAGDDRWGPGSFDLLGSSPNGDRLLFGKYLERVDPASSASLWSVNTDGSGAQMLVAGTDVGAWVSLPADAEEPVTP